MTTMEIRGIGGRMFTIRTDRILAVEEADDEPGAPDDAKSMIVVTSSDYFLTSEPYAEVVKCWKDALADDIRRPRIATPQ